jgi:hypothetical protein
VVRENDGWGRRIAGPQGRRNTSCGVCDEVPALTTNGTGSSRRRGGNASGTEARRGAATDCVSPRRA